MKRGFDQAATATSAVYWPPQLARQPEVSRCITPDPMLSSCDPWLSKGTYVLLNARGGTALDVTGNMDIQGHEFHGGVNQQWRFIPTGRGWAIQSGRNGKDGKPLYLSFKSRLREQAVLTASKVPLSWCVWDVDGALRITWPGADYVAELSGWGCDEPGAHVQLMRLKEGELRQLWYFSRCSGFDVDPKA
ncbi:hypothetical protein OH77DRAFT_1426021 [Trametes cingulata]|nr:hypothetical protein OH77DRAFT_1426021 [Trametes cingulata]